MSRHHVRKSALTGESETIAFTAEEEAAADAAMAAAMFQPLSRIQFKFMVRKLGLNEAVPQAIAALPSETDGEANFKIMAETLWEDGQSFERSHPLFAALAPALGLTSDQIDGAWLQAMTV